MTNRKVSALSLDVERLALALRGIGVIENGTWVRFKDEDATTIAAGYEAALDCDGSEYPHGSAALKLGCPDCFPEAEG